MKLVAMAVLSGAMALLCPVLVAQPARATSCVAWPGDVALQAVRGRLPGPEQTSGAGAGSPFTDTFDYALIGTIRSVDVRGLLNRYVEVIVDVDVAFFRSGVQNTVTLSMTDEGGSNGYPFEQGRTYFIPVQDSAEGTGGRSLTNYVMVCNPVREVGAAETDKLMTAAGEAGVTVSRPRSGHPAATSSDDPGPWSAIGAWSVIGVGAVAVGSVVAMRFRRRP